MLTGFLSTGCTNKHHLSYLRVTGTVKDFTSGRPLSQLPVYIPKLGITLRTDKLGFFTVADPKRKLVPGDSIIIRAATRRVTVFLSANLEFYDILLKSKPADPLPLTGGKVADMHFHVSLKPHNEFGFYLYRNKTQKEMNRKTFFVLNRKRRINVYDNPESTDAFALWNKRTDYTLVLNKNREHKWFRTPTYVKSGRVRAIDETQLESASEKRTIQNLKTLSEGLERVGKLNVA